MGRGREPPTLFVMVKAPVAGEVKTRLARTIGTGEALRFYRSVTASLLRHVGSDPRWRTVLAVSPDRYLRSQFWPMSLPRVPQGRGDIGERMQRLLDSAPGPNVLIGSDIPGVRASHIAAALRALSRQSIVFGPSEDGGFWLVGARRCPTVPRPFHNVRWSTEHALADTLSNLPGPAGFAAALTDVDTETEWRRWRRGELDIVQRDGRN
jgi:rSAM/selenodomain-associated transferase 1